MWHVNKRWAWGNGIGFGIGDYYCNFKSNPIILKQNDLSIFILEQNNLSSSPSKDTVLYTIQEVKSNSVSLRIESNMEWYISKVNKFGIGFSGGYVYYDQLTNVPKFSWDYFNFPFYFNKDFKSSNLYLGLSIFVFRPNWGVSASQKDPKELNKNGDLTIFSGYSYYFKKYGVLNLEGRFLAENSIRLKLGLRF